MAIPFWPGSGAYGGIAWVRELEKLIAGIGVIGENYKPVPLNVEDWAKKAGTLVAFSSA